MLREAERLQGSNRPTPDAGASEMTKRTTGRLAAACGKIVRRSEKRHERRIRKYNQISGMDRAQHCQLCCHTNNNSSCAAMKNLTHCILVSACLVLMSACLGLGISVSQDPVKKLDDARNLFVVYYRPHQAEYLIFEAMDVFQRENDAHGLGLAYREYGEFLESQVVANTRYSSFRDKSITFDNRFIKAKEYYGKALENFNIAVKELAAKDQYDLLTNTYYNMAVSHVALDQRNAACTDYDQALDAYNENISRHPSGNPAYPHGYSSLPDALADAKRRLGCPMR
jgi:tetratricopeptide (TPR) repeat protein